MSGDRLIGAKPACVISWTALYIYFLSNTFLYIYVYVHIMYIYKYVYIFIRNPIVHACVISWTAGGAAVLNNGNRIYRRLFRNLIL